MQQCRGRDVNLFRCTIAFSIISSGATTPPTPSGSRCTFAFSIISGWASSPATPSGSSCGFTRTTRTNRTSGPRGTCGGSTTLARVSGARGGVLLLSNWKIRSVGWCGGGAQCGWNCSTDIASLTLCGRGRSGRRVHTMFLRLLIRGTAAGNGGKSLGIPRAPISAKPGTSWDIGGMATGHNGQAIILLITIIAFSCNAADIAIITCTGTIIFAIIMWYYQVWCGNVPLEMTANQLKDFFIEMKWPKPIAVKLETGPTQPPRRCAILTFATTAAATSLLEQSRPGCWPDGQYLLLRSVPSLVSGVGHVILGCRCGLRLKVRSKTAGAASGCRCGLRLPVRAHASGPGSGCGSGVWLQVRTQAAGAGEVCRGGRILNVRANAEGAGSGCMCGLRLQLRAPEGGGGAAGTGSACRCWHGGGTHLTNSFMHQEGDWHHDTGLDRLAESHGTHGIRWGTLDKT